MCAKPTSSYQNAPASSAARAAALPKWRREKKYMPAGIAGDSAQNSSLTAPTYHHEAGNITLLLQRLTELYPVAAQIMRQIDADAPDPPAHAGIRFADTGKQD